MLLQALVRLGQIHFHCYSKVYTFGIHTNILNTLKLYKYIENNLLCQSDGTEALLVSYTSLMCPTLSSEEVRIALLSNISK